MAVLCGNAETRWRAGASPSRRRVRSEAPSL